MLNRLSARGAAYTALSLVAGMLLGVLVGSVVFETLPGHMGELTRSLLAALPALAGLVAGGALWGHLMGTLTGGASPARRVAWAGALSFGPAVIVLGLGLNALEIALVERGLGPDLPIHILFTLLFVPAAFLAAGVSALSLGAAVRGWRFGARLGLETGAVAGGAFLVLNLVMDALGWRVGAPGAAERYTMVTVLMVGSLGAALAGGAVLGGALIRTGEARRPRRID